MNTNQNQINKDTKKEKIMELMGLVPNSNEYKQVEKYINALQAQGKYTQLTPQQLYTFLNICYSYKLDPLKNEIYAIPRQNKTGGYDLQITISFYQYIKAAETHPKYQTCSVTTITTDKDGNKLPIDDYVCIFRGKRTGDEQWFERKFYLREWKALNPMWNSKPIMMLEKTAMKNGLAWLYPNLNGYLEVDTDTSFLNITPDGENTADTAPAKIESDTNLQKAMKHLPKSKTKAVEISVASDLPQDETIDTEIDLESLLGKKVENEN